MIASKDSTVTSEGEAQKSDPTLALCICTMDREPVLRRCLDSIARGSKLPTIVFVSDDSKRPMDTQALCRSYPWVEYVAGPRQGLCANRNHILRNVNCQFVSLLDDDAAVSHEFVATLYKVLRDLGTDKTVVTGDVLEGNKRIQPKNPSFWGHFTRPTSAKLETINLNCNAFPADAFRQASFDEKIDYGYEDMDLCSHLLALGYQIAYHPRLFNQHYPQLADSTLLRTRATSAERARFYTSVKRYRTWQRNPLKTLAYCILAPLHRAAHALKHGKVDDLPRCFHDMFFAIRETGRTGATVPRPT